MNDRADLSDGLKVPAFEPMLYASRTEVEGKRQIWFLYLISLNLVGKLF